jgi:hypothetical protein
MAAFDAVVGGAVGLGSHDRGGLQMISPAISVQIAKVDEVGNPRTTVALTVRDLTVPMRG